MDSITQIVLGAAVGQAVLGRKVGRKAAIWGAALGIAPDLDVLFSILLDPVNSLTVHRAATHSLPVLLLASIPIGLALSNVYRKNRLAKEEWVYFTAWILTIHIILDVFTAYGTRIFWPFTSQQFSLDTVFIVDPLVTLPLIAGLAISWFARKSPKIQYFANIAGLLLVSVYLTWAAGTKMVMHATFKQEFSAKGFHVDKLMTTPTPLNTVLWTGIGLQGDMLLIGQRSILDDKKPQSITFIQRNSHLLDGHENDRAVQRLMWFSKGWYSIEEVNDELIFSDQRFGSSNSWMLGDDVSVFRFKLQSDGQEYTTFEPLPMMDGIQDISEALASVYGRARSN